MWAMPSARSWGWTSESARGSKLKIKDDLEVMGNDERKGKWVDERKGKGKGGESS